MLRALDFRPVRRPAVVSRAASNTAEYLRLEPNGSALWVADPARATPFGSMREAARMAFRLPAAERAFGMPLAIELDTYDNASLH